VLKSANRKPFRSCGHRFRETPASSQALANSAASSAHGRSATYATSYNVSARLLIRSLLADREIPRISSVQAFTSYRVKLSSLTICSRVRQVFLVPTSGLDLGCEPRLEELVHAQKMAMSTRRASIGLRENRCLPAERRLSTRSERL
jgi:hypothetical protein